MTCVNQVGLKFLHPPANVFDMIKRSPPSSVYVVYVEAIVATITVNSLMFARDLFGEIRDHL